MTTPLVSIIVPSFNQGTYIRETLDSIFRQDYRPLEIIVSDGGSTDQTVDILRSYGERPELTWWSEKDRGVVDAVNKGLARAHGEILAIQSSDDLYVDGAVCAAVTRLKEDHEAMLLYGDVEYIDAASRVTGRTTLPPFDLLEYVGKLSYIPQPAAFFRAEAPRLLGGWREEISYAADAEFFLRIALRFRVVKIERVLARYRYHEEQRDTAGEKIMRDWAAAMEPLTQSEQKEMRRHARGGVHLARYHYTPEARWVRRTWELYRAVAANPSLLRRREIRSLREWVPGRYPIWRALSRIKRLAGLPARTTV